MLRQPKKGSFPRLSITAAIKIIKEASKIKGKIKKATFAGFGARKNKNPSITSGAFNDKLNALRSFGLIIIDNDEIELTDLAIKIIDPISLEEEHKALLQCFMGVGTFKTLLDTLKIETPINLKILHEQAVNTIGIHRNQRINFVNFFINAAEKVGLITRIDKNTIKRKAQTIIEALTQNTTDSFGVATTHSKPTVSTPENNTQETGPSTTFYPYTDRGDGWTLEIKITSTKNLSHEVRGARIKLGELLETLNSGI